MAIHKISTDAPDPDDEHNEPEQEHESQQHSKPKDPNPVTNPADLIKKIAAEAKSGFKQPEPGLYSAIVTKIEMVQFETGWSLRASYVLDYSRVDEEIGIFKDSQIFRITKADMQTPDDWGPDFYGRFMSKLGFPAENRGQEAWDEIADRQPGIALKITRAKDPDYRNRQVMGQLDNDDEGIAYIRQTLQERPY